MSQVEKSNILNKKNDRKRFTWRGVPLAILILIFAGFFYFFKIAEYDFSGEEPISYEKPFGITFSTKFCNELGLGWKETYRAILDELEVKYIRIPVYWDEIEKEEGVYDFTDYDYLVEAGASRNVKFIISIGRRIPRWPECHSPAWLNRKDDSDARAATMKMIKTVVEHYRDYESVEYWQVENEAFLGTFGVCPPLDEELLRDEFDLVRSLDNRKIIITGSGELSFWKKEAEIGDIFGSTLYRSVYNKVFGHVRYPFPVWFYKAKAKWAGLEDDQVMILELQTEPWVPVGKMIYLSNNEINRTMSISQFKANLRYAANLNFSRTYTWGAEWWYWQKKYGNPEYWRIATDLFKNNTIAPAN
ncbi:MAG: endo-1,4-beta-xylanase [Patescibacteria group bacterium]|jgi:hypothetical protein